MQYMLLLHADENQFAKMTPTQQQEGYAAYLAYADALREAGAYVAGERLRSASTATTVRVKDGQTQVLDGPFMETKEQIGGYFLIEAEDLDVALAWAARCPGARHGVVEVRPIWSM